MQWSDRDFIEWFVSDKEPVITPFYLYKEEILKDKVPYLYENIKDDVDWGIINEFYNKPVIMSRGLSYAGYDLRLHNLQVLSKDGLKILDYDFGREAFILPPHSFALGETVEILNIPEHATGFVVNKSSYVRLGVSMPYTILEPGWRGSVTLEITNQTDTPQYLYKNQGIGQLIIQELKSEPIRAYEGKYQFQNGITQSR